MPKFQPTLAIASAAPLRKHRRATLSTSRSVHSWPRSSSSKGEACRLDPALAELSEDRPRRFCCQLHTKLGQFGRPADQRVEAAACEPGIDAPGDVDVRFPASAGIAPGAAARPARLPFDSITLISACVEPLAPIAPHNTKIGYKSKDHK